MIFMENILPVKSNTLQCTEKLAIYSQVNGLAFYMFQFTKTCDKLKAINITVFMNDLNDCPFQKIFIYVDNI